MCGVGWCIGDGGGWVRESVSGKAMEVGACFCETMEIQCLHSKVSMLLSAFLFISAFHFSVTNKNRILGKMFCLFKAKFSPASIK